ncbi:MAG: hypothetical protein IJB79_04975, partial [Candidatus Gastranaerophilales bacterium]|nr:hypothetical protein [Candidatus Gastranaerophilales bacterium]
MAEAILVMTILGIIATIMITTLKPAEFKEKGLKVSAKKVLSEIDTATTQILVNNTKLGSFNSLVHDNGTNFTWKGNGATVLEYYKKYLTTIRTIVPSTSFCITGDSSRNAKAVYLKDGACIGIYDSETTNAQTIFPGETTTKQSNASQGLLLFDTNGEEEPNTIGVDRFILPIDSSGIAYDTIADAGGGASPEPEPTPEPAPEPTPSPSPESEPESEYIPPDLVTLPSEFQNILRTSFPDVSVEGWRKYGASSYIKWVDWNNSWDVESAHYYCTTTSCVYRGV